MNMLAVDHLDVAADQKVLDLGFGGGVALVTLLGKGAKVTGVDRAPDMVAAALTKHREAVDSGRLTLIEGEVGSLPFADASFERVLTINTVYFWPDLPTALTEVARVLAAGGLLVIGIRDPSAMRRVSRDIFTVRPVEEVREAVVSAGFEDAQLISPPDQKIHLVLARR